MAIASNQAAYDRLFQYADSDHDGKVTGKVGTLRGVSAMLRRSSSAYCICDMPELSHISILALQDAVVFFEVCGRTVCTQDLLQGKQGIQSIS